MKLIVYLASVIYAGVLYDKNSDFDSYELENFALYESPKLHDSKYQIEMFKYQLKDKVKIDGDCTATGTDCSHEKNVIVRELTAIICSQEFLRDVIKDGICEIISEYCYRLSKTVTQLRLHRFW